MTIYSAAATLLAAAVTALGAASCGEDADVTGASAAKPGQKPAEPVKSIKIASVPPAKMRFTPRRLTLRPGTYKIVFDNREAIRHNVRIQKGDKCCFKPGATDVGGTDTTFEKEVITGTATLEPGRYVYLCTVGGHWQAGMRGKISVE